MRNFLNFTGKSLFVLVFSFLTISTFLTSCSPDSSSDEVVNPNPTNLTSNVPSQIEYNPSSNGDNYVKEGTGNSVVLGTLFNSSLNGQLTVSLSGSDSGLVEVVNGQLKTKSNVSFTTGTKSVNYTVSQNGTTYSTTGSLYFDVYYGEDFTFDVIINRYTYNVSGNPQVYDSNIVNEEGITITGVPYQYLLNYDENTEYTIDDFQLCQNGVNDAANDFNNTTGTSQWRICKLKIKNGGILPDYFLPNGVNNRTIKTKTHNGNTFLELRVNYVSGSNTNTVLSFDQSSNTSNCTETAPFGCTQI